MAATVVLAYDGSEDAGHAIAVAGELIGGGSAVVVFVQVQLPPPILGAAPDGPTEDELLKRHIDSHARKVIDKGLELAKESGFEPDAVNRIADGIAGVWQTIIEVARERDADVIVVGHRGLSRVKSALLGSVSNGLVNHSSVPVLVVPPSQ